MIQWQFITFCFFFGKNSLQFHSYIAPRVVHVIYILATQNNSQCLFGITYFYQLILLFSLFLLLFMGLIVLFQLIFIFIYNTFSTKKKKKLVTNRTEV